MLLVWHTTAVVEVHIVTDLIELRVGVSFLRG
jgi:hypothetical protein